MPHFPKEQEMLQSNRANNLIPSSLLRPGLAFIAIIFCALVAFEIFNYSTTDLALGDLLGNLTFMSIRWSTILALAFCGIDFAGVARLFTPEQGENEPKEVWYLFGAWMLAATMNAILTWWGVSMAVTNHPINSSSVVDPKTISGVVPIFVAIMVWVIRILIIGTLSLALDRYLHAATGQPQIPQPRSSAQPYREPEQRERQPQYNTPPSRIPAGIGSAQQRSPAPKPVSAAPRPGFSSQEPEETQGMPSRPRIEPGYHSVTGQNRGVRR
jgi:hypothetical protein